MSLNLKRSILSLRCMIAFAIMLFTLAGLNAHAQAAKGQEEFSISGDLFVPVKDT